MIERNDQGEVTSINCGIGSGFPVWVESSQPLDYEEEIFIGCSNETARAIDKLPEIMEHLNAVADIDNEARQLVEYINGDQS